MNYPSFFKEVTKSSVDNLNLEADLSELLDLFFEKTNEKVIGYYYPTNKKVYIKSKVLHEVASVEEKKSITISKIAKQLKTKSQKENELKDRLKKYLYNYNPKSVIVHSTLSILGEVMTMVCLSKDYYNLTFYEFLDEIFFNRFFADIKLSTLDVYTRINVTTKKLSMMASIYDDSKINDAYYAWLYSSYYGSKKISEKCGSGSNYEYHHEESEFVDFIKNSKTSDRNRCFTWMENYNKSIKKQFFAEGNKLSTADIYLVKKGRVNEIKKLFEKKTFLDPNNNKLLNIVDYLKLVTRLYRIKHLFPVSLKQVESPNPPFSVLNYSSVFAQEKKEDDDWFYKEMLYLQELSKNKDKFTKYVENLIELEDFQYSPQRATQSFYFKYNIKNKALNYFLEMVAGRASVLIKPIPTSSQTGEGQITYQVFNEMTNIASYKQYFSAAYRDLISSRVSILNLVSPNNSVAKQKLRKVGVLTKGEMSEVINSFNSDKVKYDFMNEYAEFLINKKISKKLTQGIKTKYQLLDRSGKLNTRNLTQFIGFLLDLEFLYFISTNQNKVKEFAKKKIILSMHSAASGRGYLVVSQSRFKQGKKYLSGLQSALTVKVGL